MRICTMAINNPAIRVKNIYLSLMKDYGNIECDTFEFKLIVSTAKGYDKFIVALPKDSVKSKNPIRAFNRFIKNDNRCFRLMKRFGFISCSPSKMVPSRYISNNFVVSQVNPDEDTIFDPDSVAADRYHQLNYYTEIYSYSMNNNLKSGFVIIPYVERSFLRTAGVFDIIYPRI